MTASTMDKSPAAPADQPSILRRFLLPVFFLVVVIIPWAFLFRAAAPATTVVFAPSVDIVGASPPVVLVPAAESTPTGLSAGGDRIESGSTATDEMKVEGSSENSSSSSNMSEEERLEKVLGAAATEDRTVVLTLLNAAWSEPGSVLELFMESFRIGNGTAWLLNHLVIVSVDEKAHRRCQSIHPHCYALVTEGVDFSGYKEFMSADYLRMMWRRLEFLRIVLERGFNFIFSDVDIMWFRDPFPHFVSDGDVQLACDLYVGDPKSPWNGPNNGFNYVKASNRTVTFYRFWYESRERYPGEHEQNVLNHIKRDPYLDQIGVRLRFLDTDYFSGICQMSKDFNKICTFHVNCCIGLKRKLHDLNLMLDDWRKFMALPPALQATLPHEWSVPDQCGWGAKKRPRNETKHRL